MESFWYAEPSFCMKKATPILSSFSMYKCIPLKIQDPVGAYCGWKTYTGWQLHICVECSPDTWNENVRNVMSQKGYTSPSCNRFNERASISASCHSIPFVLFCSWYHFLFWLCYSCALHITYCFVLNLPQEIQQVKLSQAPRGSDGGSLSSVFVPWAAVKASKETCSSQLIPKEDNC